MRTTIRTKIFGVSLFAAGILALAGLLFSSVSQTLQQSFDRIISEGTPRIVAVLNARSILFEISGALLRAENAPTPEDFIQAKNMLFARIDELNHEELTYEKFLTIKESPDLLRDFSLAKSAFTSALVDELLVLPTRDALKISTQKSLVKERATLMESALSRLLRFELARQESEKTVAIIDAKNKTNLEAGVLGIMTILLLAIALYINKSLSRPIYELKNALGDVARGDFEHLIKVEGEGDIVDLAKAYNLMLIRIKNATQATQTRAEELKQALASVADGVLMVGVDGNVALVNSVAEELIARAEDEMLGKYVTDVIMLVHKDGTPIQKENWSDPFIVRNNKELEQDCYLQTTRGELIAVSIFVAPVFNSANNNLFGSVVTIRDMRAARQLEDARMSFIAVASHQLRTPLTSMRWFAEMLTNGDAGELSEDQKAFVGRIYESADRMINLVNLLLQIGRVEAKRVRIAPEPLAILAVTNTVIDSLRPTLEARKQQVKIMTRPEVIPQISMGKDVIWEVIRNLLVNASHYSPEGSIIEIIIVLKGDILEYAVRDYGIGIPDADKPKIFQKFYRAENAIQYVPEGSGLGLALVKSLVEGWGGVVRFESIAGKGTTFFFTVPRAGMKPQEGDASLSV